MKQEKGFVSSSGVVLLIAGFLFGSSILISPGSIAGRDAWAAQIIGLAESLCLAGIMSLLLNRFPRMTIIEINRLVYGQILGGLISIAFIWFLLHLGSMVLLNFLDFLKLNMLPLTPPEVIVFLGILPCIYTVKKGVEVIVRCSQVLVPLSILFLLLLTAFLALEYDFKNLKPILAIPLPKLLWAGHVAGSFPFEETVAFLMILPFLNKRGKSGRTHLMGLLLGWLILAAATLRTTAVLGESAGMYMYPPYHAVRMINIAEFLSRLEVLAAINYLTMGILKIIVLLYGASLGWAQIFNLKSYRPLVIPLGILLAVLSLNNFRNVVENFEFINKVYPIYALPFEWGIPILTLLVAMVRKLPKEG